MFTIDKIITPISLCSKRDVRKRFLVNRGVCRGLDKHGYRTVT